MRYFTMQSNNFEQCSKCNSRYLLATSCAGSIGFCLSLFGVGLINGNSLTIGNVSGTCCVFRFCFLAHDSVYFYHEITNKLKGGQDCHTIPVNICLKASSTPVESKAEVSMKARLFLSANAIASSVFTARL